MPVKTRHQYKRESIKNERRRNPVRTRSREEALERANVERQKSLVVKRLKPEVVRDKAVVCVKPVREIKLKLHQRKLKHLCGTSRPEHPAYTRCPKMWGPAALTCSKKRCECRGKIHGAHVAFRVARRSKVRQFGIVATCASSNMTSGSFKCRRGTSVFVLARVRSRYPSIPYNPNEDTIIDNGLFENGSSRIDRLERELMELGDEEDLDSYANDYFDVMH